MNQLQLITTVFFSLIFGANAFSYKEAKKWGKKYPECNGKHQSPIIIYDDLNHDDQPIDQKLKLIDFDKLPRKMTIKNTGHTVEIKADWSGEPPKINGGPLHGNYVLGKTTFHWTQGKWVDDVVTNYPSTPVLPYEMEMHMFFYKTDFKSFEKAQKQKGGLAALKLGLGVGPNLVHIFDSLEKNLHKVQYPNSTAEIPPFRLASFYDGLPATFYEGSLDYPPCFESVTWFLPGNLNAVTDGLIKEFKKIKLAGGDVSNVRPFQPLNKRQLKMVAVDNTAMDF